MKWSKKIRLSVGFHKLLKEVKQLHRQPAVRNLNDAKSIGILYNATEDENYDTVMRYMKSLRELHKDVHTLGFVDRPSLLRHQFAKLGLDYFTQKHLNFYFLPNYHVVTNFINEEFDILICLNIENAFPLKYVAALSKAHFRVGKYNKSSTAFYDLMIDVEDSGNLKGFIGQVDHYLKVINKGNLKTS